MTSSSRFFASLAASISLLGGCALVESPADDALTMLQGDLAACQARYDALAESDLALRGSMDALRADVAAMTRELAQDRAERQAAFETPVTETVEAGDEAAVDPGKLVVGRRERVWVEELQIALPARIDTGAETASLDARNITHFERDGRPWVRFEIARPDSQDKIVLERKKIRDALILQSNSDQAERRPVIELGIRLGDVRQLAEFTLSDRSHLDYQMLVGRNILRDVMLVDVSAVNLVPMPEKPEPPPAPPEA